MADRSDELVTNGERARSSHDGAERTRDRTARVETAVDSVCQPLTTRAERVVSGALLSPTGNHSARRRQQFRPGSRGIKSLLGGLQRPRYCTDGGIEERRPTSPATELHLPEHASHLQAAECGWCGAPFPEAAPTLVAHYDPDGELYEVDRICESCDRYGPPHSSRRDRREWAEQLRTTWSRLERLGWWLVEVANR